VGIGAGIDEGRRNRRLFNSVAGPYRRDVRPATRPRPALFV